MSLVDLSRWQFATTVICRMTFPAITVRLSILLSVVYGLYWRTGRAVYLQMWHVVEGVVDGVLGDDPGAGALRPQRGVQL
ncbi:cytochrome ubiquinol oxidase subunit I [Streptomyces phaeochromogenes]